MALDVQCWSCQKVKGRRSCPAHGGDTICSRCCGTKRRVEIRCPENCPYLHGEHDPRWEAPGQKTEDLRFLSRFAGVSREQVPFLIFFHSLLLRASRDLSSGLSDEELKVAVSTLRRTYETLSKGVLYEHKTEDLRLQNTISRLGEILTRRKEISGVPPASDTDVLAVLASTQSAIEAHESAADDPTSKTTYLDIAQRVFRAAISEFPAPEPPGESRAGRLIVEP
ncbi:MAG TPA: hypothetical protein VGC53_10695 [Vicinamibacteria bacterium]|jgi:hypothetical protein